MSEKRFAGKLLTNSNGEEFGFTIYDKDKRMNIDEVVDCLNEQQAIIEQLQRICETINSLYNRLNEQQATIRRLQDLCGESDGENAKLRIKNKRLQAENEELRFALRAEQALAKIQSIK